MSSLLALDAFSGLLSASSSIVAARLAARVGVLNVMVFTHLPSNLLLAAIALCAFAHDRDRATPFPFRAVTDGYSGAAGGRLGR